MSNSCPEAPSKNQVFRLSPRGTWRLKTEGCASRKCGNNRIKIVPKYFQSSWNILFVAIIKLISMERPVKEVNDIIVPDVKKLSVKLSTLYLYRRQVPPAEELR